MCNMCRYRGRVGGVTREDIQFYKIYKETWPRIRFLMSKNDTLDHTPRKKSEPVHVNIKKVVQFTIYKYV